MSASTLFEDCGSGMITVASFLQYFKNNFLNYQVSILTLFVLTNSGPKHNARSLSTPFSDTVYFAAAGMVSMVAFSTIFLLVKRFQQPTRFFEVSKQLLKLRNKQLFFSVTLENKRKATM